MGFGAAVTEEKRGWCRISMVAQKYCSNLFIIAVNNVNFLHVNYKVAAFYKVHIGERPVKHLMVRHW